MGGRYRGLLIRHDRSPVLPVSNEWCERQRITLSANVNAGARTETSREASAQRLFGEAGGRCRKAQERICIVSQLSQDAVGVASAAIGEATIKSAEA
jgi:hypothetical protein